MGHGKTNTIEGLDGIRALAVGAVIVLHGDLNHFLPGGFLGVDVFFVLSGFLITSLLIRELKETGTVSFFRFYSRRIRRLLPTLLTVLFACSAYTIGFAHDAIKALRSDILPALLYYSNIWQLYDAQPYFERFGRPHALQHLWSLAIEEQFYLFWPPLILLISRIKRKHALAALIGLLCLFSIVWMGWLAEVNNIPYENKPERVYFGTDTHAIGLLLGAFLASWHQPRSLSQPKLLWRWNVVGGIALVYLIGCFFVLNESWGFLYRGGFASVSLASAFLILAASMPGTLVNVMFRSRLAEWIGKRSYTFYLWHWPVFVYFRPGDELPDNLPLAFLIRLFLTLILSDTTYRFIELPIRTDGFQAFGKNRRAFFAGTFASIVLAFGALYLSDTPRASTSEMQVATADIHAATMDAQSTPADIQAEPTDNQAESTDTQAESTVPMAVVSPDESIAAHHGNLKESTSISGEGNTYDLDLTDIRVTALGDSVMLGAQSVIARNLPVAHFDAMVGRQGSDLLKLVQGLIESKELSDTVLIHIGTNGYIYEQHLDRMLHALQDRKNVFLINIHANRCWTDDNNALLKKYQKKYSNVTLIDWNAASEGHPEYFVKDGIHLTGKGMAAYADVARLALGVPKAPKRVVLTAMRPTGYEKRQSTPFSSDTTSIGASDAPPQTETLKPVPEQAGEASDAGA